MSTQFDLAKNDTQFFRTYRRILLIVATLVGLFLAAFTYAILRDRPSDLQNWRGIACIALAIAAFLLYLIPMFMGSRCGWPPPLPYALSCWTGLYVAICLLTLINIAFVWSFYILLATSVSLFGGKRLILAVSVMTITMFALQGVFVWPPSGATILTMSSQILTIVSIVCFTMLFQYVMKERFEKNDLLQQLSEANSELKTAHQQLELSVVHEQELAVLRERARLAREMHDSIGHALVLITVKLEAAQRLLARDPERGEHEVASTKDVARTAMSALRASIADLRAPEREYLHQALLRSTRELAQRTGLKINYSLQTETDDLPEFTRETLWKVSQEALTNIEKHAQASQVQLYIRRECEQLLMRIEDDGVGIPLEKWLVQQEESSLSGGSVGHYGLRGMRERVEALGGRMSLYSDQGQGTRIEIWLPVEQR